MSCKFRFNDLEHKERRSFDSSAPSYRVIIPGLNFDAKCSNSLCSAYMDSVTVQKGFGFFNVGKEIYMCKCPSCGRTTEPATNFYYYRTNIEVLGKLDHKSQLTQWE